MKNIKKNIRENKIKITEIGTTKDILCSRGGLFFFHKYLQSIKVDDLILKYFGALQKNKKGKDVFDLFSQLICFFVDGTNNSISYLDELKEDVGYALSIERKKEGLISSHSAKRFFKKFSHISNFTFRKLFQDLFIWRLKQEAPEYIELDVDVFILDNDDADKREGCQPTYKKKKGFSDYAVKWKAMVIDNLLRGGAKHSNSGNTVKNSLKHIISRIRKEYREDVEILINMDAGFFDDKIFNFLEDVNVKYVCSGRVYDSIQKRGIEEFEKEEKYFKSSNQKINKWQYADLQDKRGTWEKYRRAIYTCQVVKDSQRLLPSFGVDRIYYTNIEDLPAEDIIRIAHKRGIHELVHRKIKDFVSEKLPFKKFQMNSAYYNIAILSFNLYECFKKDVTEEIVSPACYATTFRRTFLDFAGKIVSSARKIILKVSKSTMKRLKLEKIWLLCLEPPKIC